MRIAVAQVAPWAGSGSAGGDRAAALDLAGELATAAAAAGAKLLLLPQGFLAGPGTPPAGEPSDGPGARAMGAVARDAGLALAYGYAEACSGAVHDSLMLFDAAGRAVANYRRAHVERRDDPGGFGAGQWLSAALLDGRRVGFLVGYDLAFPEAARALRLAGCDLLLAAVGRDGGLDPGAARALLAARAIENRCAVALASADPELAPAVAGPDGRPLAGAAGHPALLVADLPPRTDGAVAAGAAALRDRRPRLYARLTATGAVEAG